MIRLFAGLLVAGSFFAVAAQEVQIAADQAHLRPIARSVKGERGASIKSAVVNFSELAAEEAAKSKKAPTKQKLHKPMPAPKGLLGRGATVGEEQLVTAQQLVPPTANSPAPSTNFLGAPDNGTYIPPDTMGAVGPRHLMVTLNGTVRIQDRGGAVLSSVTLNQFWSRVGPFVSNGTFDPKVYYDAVNGRWFTVACADGFSNASAVLFGISATDDPLGAWNLYKIDADTTDAYWADYPSVGHNSQWIAVTMNMFPNSATTYGGTFVWVFSKAQLLTGPLQASFTLLKEPSGFTMTPATTYDQSEQTLHIVETFDERSLRLSTITGPIGQESLNVGVANVQSGVSWNVQGGQVGKQLGSTAGIECNDTRILSCVFRNGAIWASHSIFFPATGAPNRAAAQWWQMSPNGSILQQGLLDDPTGNTSYSMPTLTVNRNDDMLLGYTRFDPTIYASAAYSFRSAADPPGTLQAEQILKAGEGPYFKDFGSGENRWGDYSATMVDPLNDQDIWTLQEYAAAPVGSTSQWGTWWGMVLLSTPPDDILEIRVSPPDGADIAQGQPTDFFAVVTDSFLPINNATVQAAIPGRPSPVTFRNDGVAPDVRANDNIYSATITLNNSTEARIVFTASAIGKTSGSQTNTYQVLPRPANDNFANARKVPAGGIFDLTIDEIPNNFATTEVGEPLHAGVSNARSLWWNYSTDTASSVLVDTSGSGPEVVLAVYTGNSLTALSLVGSAISTNVGPAREALLKFDAQAGVTYRIAVAGKGPGDKGIVRLRVQPNGEPDTAPPIVTVQFPPSGLVTNVNSITFRGTAIDPAPHASGVNSVLIQDLNQRPRTVVQATLSGTVWTANIVLSRATNEYLVTGVDFADNTSSGQRITIYYRETGTTNDLFGFARPLALPSGVEFASNTNANKEFNEPLHGGNEGGASLWWTYRPEKSGVLLISTEGSDFDTLLGVYTVNDPLDRSFSKLIPIAQNDDIADGTNGSSEVSIAVEAGRLYFIAVDGYGGETGNVRLQYTFAETGVFNVTTSSAGGGTISPSSMALPADSAVTVTAIPDRYMQFSRFRITQNGVTSIVTTGPSYTFSLTGNTEVVAEFEPKRFADDFQTGDFSRLPYQISSSPNVGQHWVVASVETNSVTQQSSLVARVKPGLPDATTASLVIMTNLAAGVGSFEFSVNTETNYDKFEFSLDGRVLGAWSGVVPWQTFFFDIPAKATPVRLEWRYIKDLAVSAPNELVAIDNIDIQTVAPPPPLPVTMSITADASQVTVIAAGPPHTDLRLETSTNLINWTPVPDGERNTGAGGATAFIQPAPAGTARFYRVVQL